MVVLVALLPLLAVPRLALLLADLGVVDGLLIGGLLNLSKGFCLLDVLSVVVDVIRVVSFSSGLSVN